MGAIRARVRRDPDFRARATILRLPSPESRPIRAVRVNNQDFKDFSDDEIRLPAGAEVDVVATY